MSSKENSKILINSKKKAFAYMKKKNLANQPDVALSERFRKLMWEIRNKNITARVPNSTASKDHWLSQIMMKCNKSRNWIFSSQKISPPSKTKNSPKWAILIRHRPITKPPSSQKLMMTVRDLRGNHKIVGWNRFSRSQKWLTIWTKAEIKVKRRQRKSSLICLGKSWCHKYL